MGPAKQIWQSLAFLIGISIFWGLADCCVGIAWPKEQVKVPA